MARPENDIRKRILDGALDIIEEAGIKALTQPRLARTTGLRQSHLTYYFPRKADLYMALLEASHERAAARATPAKDTPLATLLANLMFDRERMRFFLSIILEIDDDPELRPALAAHAAGLASFVAGKIGRCPTDPAVLAFIDELRGAGLKILLEPSDHPGDVLVREIASNHGLVLQ
ncbi:TetR family transcriptional regulator [Shinella sp.]|uniref:TetR family transcriptional regulator n=1 Tax=Shinella sp. TaxID=1870904 RepID=UPI0039E5910C